MPMPWRRWLEPNDIPAIDGANDEESQTGVQPAQRPDDGEALPAVAVQPAELASPEDLLERLGGNQSNNRTVQESLSLAQPLFKCNVYRCLKRYDACGLCSVVFSEFEGNSAQLKVDLPVVLGAVFILVAQLAAPTILLISSILAVVNGSDDAFSHNAAPAARVLMFVILALYYARAAALRTKKGAIVSALMLPNEPYPSVSYPAAEASEEFCEEMRRVWQAITYTTFNKSWAASCDRFMTNWYEQALYLLNLWLVFITPKPTEMLINALALEFIMDLDNKFMEQYWLVSGKAGGLIHVDALFLLSRAVLPQPWQERPYLHKLGSAMFLMAYVAAFAGIYFKASSVET